jgi:hypothetical protein
MGLGMPEVILVLLILVALAIVVLRGVLGYGSRRRFSELEDRVERLERQLGQTSEPADRASKPGFKK